MHENAPMRSAPQGWVGLASGSARLGRPKQAPRVSASSGTPIRLRGSTNQSEACNDRRACRTVHHSSAMPKADLTQSWIAAAATLPPEWQLMGVVRGPREVDPKIQSDSWMA